MPGANGESAATHFRIHGMDATTVDAVRNRNQGYFASLVPAMPLAFTRMIRGRASRSGGRTWRVIIGLGHSPEHAALYCAEDELLISGDMVLPRISTNVSVFDIEPLRQSGAVVRRFAEEVPGRAASGTLVLPSHGRPFRKLHVRLRQLTDHHEERLSMLLAACREGGRWMRRRSGRR